MLKLGLLFITCITSNLYCMNFNQSDSRKENLASVSILQMANIIDKEIQKKFISGEALFSRSFILKQHRKSQQQIAIVFDFDQTIADKFYLNPLIEPLLKELKKRNCRLIIWSIAADTITLKRFFLRYPNLEKFFDQYMLSNLEIQLKPLKQKSMLLLKSAYNYSRSAHIRFKDILDYYKSSCFAKNIAIYNYHLIVDDDPDLIKHNQLSPTLLKPKGIIIPKFFIPLNEETFLKDNPDESYNDYVEKYCEQYLIDNSQDDNNFIQNVLASIDLIEKNRKKKSSLLSQKKQHSSA